MLPTTVVDASSTVVAETPERQYGWAHAEGVAVALTQFPTTPLIQGVAK
ncbi:hypothetical protein [Methylotenera sp.]|nr:hypothetical protein [Methylotenera sp.]MDO9393457.1 hypothetical protein [Methylotenera sp.]MDP1522097.1 hypothetical protein [Methylotenera sp.]MDP2072253.1 hypothetical protein [Methylotenera sp.]MDP2229558.1 hypothetical protein [Methylotenera sp.]MDP3005052.1 hypothetical protein [Methylotenera sp.]